MNSVLYDALARSKLLREVNKAFREATNLSVALVPPDEPPRRRAAGKGESAFCALMAASGGACAVCTDAERELQRRLSHKLAPQTICCFAGLIELAVPVVVGGQHVATLWGGHAFRGKPGRRQFDRVIRQVRRLGLHASRSKIKQTYFHTPVLSENQFRGAVRLLAILAKQLGESANRCLLASQRHEPPSVTKAKAYINSHSDEEVTLDQTSMHVHVSRYHFSKVFKHATGMTFTEFLARVRVENAKRLIGDPQWRIGDVSQRAGFNSISQFNRVFRRYAGIAPTTFRAALFAEAGPRSRANACNPARAAGPPPPRVSARG